MLSEMHQAKIYLTFLPGNRWLTVSCLLICGIGCFFPSYSFAARSSKHESTQRARIAHLKNIPNLSRAERKRFIALENKLRKTRKKKDKSKIAKSLATEYWKRHRYQESIWVLRDGGFGEEANRKEHNIEQAMQSADITLSLIHI